MSDSNGTEQAFTGERFLPDAISGPIRFEHLHRYAVAGLFVRGKEVLDIACGDGYGSAILGRYGGAEKVVGVDIDGPTIIRAKQLYPTTPSLSFLVGSTDAIPLPDASVDCVVSFETIEHHDRHSLMFQEFDRVLKTGGIVILSSPNRPVYSEGRGYTNPFHVKELDGTGLMDATHGRFPAVRLWGQKLRGASFIYPVKASDEFIGTPAETFRAYSPIEHSEWEIGPGVSLESPMYFFAVCARREEDLPPVDLLDAVSTVFADASDDLIASEIARIATEMSRGYESEIASRQAELLRTQHDFQTVRSEADALLERVMALEQERDQAVRLLDEWEAGPYGKLRRTVRQIRGVKPG